MKFRRHLHHRDHRPLSILPRLSPRTTPGVLTAADLKKLVPAAYFFRGQTASRSTAECCRLPQ